MSDSSAEGKRSLPVGENAGSGNFSGTLCSGFAPRLAHSAAQLGHRLRGGRFSCFYGLLSSLRADSAAGRRRAGPGGRRRAPLRADCPRDAGALRLGAHAEGPAERLRHPLSLRPSLAGEAGALLLAGDVRLSGFRRARLGGAAALDHLRLHHGGAHLPAHAAIPPWRPPGRGADHRGLRRHHRLCPRRIHRYADGRAAGHRPAGLVRLVRDRLQVLALRHLLLYRRGHAGQRAGGAVSGHC